VDGRTNAVRPERLPKRTEGTVRVRSLWSGVSRGTESLVVRGGVPASEFERMRGPHMGGAFPFPVKYGYSSVGRVVEGSVSFAKGDVVFCLHPHQTEYVVSEKALTKVPAAVPPRRAVLAPNMETAVNIVWDSGVSVGDRVVVVGAGVVGLLVAYLCRKVPGTAVYVKDVLERDFFGLTPLTDDQRDFDVVIHCSGNPVALRDCLDLAGDDATVVEASWYGDQSVNVPLGGPFHSRRLTLKCSQVGQLPPARRPRWTHARRMRMALELLAQDDGALDELLEEPPLDFHAADFHDAYVRALQAPGGLCSSIKYDDDDDESYSSH